MYGSEENMSSKDSNRNSEKRVNSRDKEVKKHKDGSTRTYYSDGSSSHEAPMVGRTNYDKDTGEEC